MSAPNPREYEPIYAEPDAIPIEIEDSYSLEDKREALFHAEQRLEVDRNGGLEIPPEDFSGIHLSALLNLATYHLTRGATSNQDVTLGDLDDGGEQTERHAEQYKETYEELIDRLAEAGPDGQSGTYFGSDGEKGTTMAANSGEDSNRHRLGGGTDIDPVHPDYVRYD